METPPPYDVCLRTVDHESGIIARERDVSKSGDLASFDKLLRLSQGLDYRSLFGRGWSPAVCLVFIKKYKAINNFLLLVRPKRKLVSCDDARDAKSN